MDTRKQVYLLILFQVLDAVFTLWGVHSLGMGIEVEGNPLMRYLMSIFGAVPTILVVKLLAVIILLKFIQPTYSRIVRLLIEILCSIYMIVVGIWAYIYIINWSW